MVGSPCNVVPLNTGSFRCRILVGPRKTPTFPESNPNLVAEFNDPTNPGCESWVLSDHSFSQNAIANWGCILLMAPVLGHI